MEWSRAKQPQSYRAHDRVYRAHVWESNADFTHPHCWHVEVKRRDEPMRKRGAACQFSGAYSDMDFAMAVAQSVMDHLNALDGILERLRKGEGS